MNKVLDLKTLSSNEVRRLATSTGWLSFTPVELQRLILDRAVVRHLTPGEFLHHVGDKPVGMFGVLTGLIRIKIVGEEHGPYLVHLLRPGAWFGEGPAISIAPRIATLKAAVESEVLLLSYKAIQDIIAQEPAYWRYFMFPLQQNLETSFGIASDLLLRDHNKRIVAALLRLGGCRNNMATHHPIEIEVSQEEIAAMTNVARTTASSVLGKLARAKIIDVGYCQITLRSPARLRALMQV